MCLFNKATPAITPTGTHVDHIPLWLLLLQFSKDDSFLKELSVDIMFIKKFGLLR